MKLFTFPFAGGSSYSFGQWSQYIKKSIQIINLDYAGHGTRIDKKLAKNLDDVIDDMVVQVLFHNKEREPFAIYGHSMGGIVAYQASLILEKKYGIKSTGTFIGACRPPHIFNKKGYHDFTYGEIVQNLIDDERLTTIMAATEHFKKSIYPVIENDFRIMSEFSSQDYVKEKLNNKVICLYGTRDKSVLYTDMLGWDQYVDNKVTFRKVDGKHFFVETQARDVCNIINTVFDSDLGGIE